MNTYIPKTNRIIHNAFVDFQKRLVNSPIHIVQYDMGAPIIAIQLYSNNAIYTLPAEAKANIRLKKRDGKVVYNPVLGCNEERNIIYVEITYQMTVEPGLIKPVIEVVFDEDALVAASSYIEIEIDKNPIQQKTVESTDEFKTIVEYQLLTSELAGQAAQSAQNAKDSENAAKVSETNAKASEIAAKDSETKAKASETAAKSSENKAKDSETKAKTSETNSKTSETNAKASETAAKNSETAAETSEANAKDSEDNAADSAAAAATSEVNAKTSETNAKDSETKAKTSEINAKTSETNAKTSETNAKASEDLAEAAKDLAVTSATTAAESADVALGAAKEALASAVRAEETDIGRLITALQKQELSVSVKDFTDDIVYDDKGEPIEAVTTFVATYKFVELSDKVDLLLSEIEHLKSHALLDSSN